MPRNRHPLTASQVEYARRAWTVLQEGSSAPVPLDVSRAGIPSSDTGFREANRTVYLGANAESGPGLDANSRMSMLACLAHELAHAERFDLGYRRPNLLPAVLVDEAETSLHASFMVALGRKDREDLIEDARDRLDVWLVSQRTKVTHDPTN